LAAAAAAVVEALAKVAALISMAEDAKCVSAACAALLRLFLAALLILERQ
jgi:hypothetical protein